MALSHWCNLFHAFWLALSVVRRSPARPPACLNHRSPPHEFLHGLNVRPGLSGLIGVVRGGFCFRMNSEEWVAVNDGYYFGQPPPPKLIGAVIHKQQSRHKVPKSVYERFLGGCSSPFMRLAEHLTAFRAWCKQCLPGW